MCIAVMKYHSFPPHNVILTYCGLQYPSGWAELLSSRFPSGPGIFRLYGFLCDEYPKIYFYVFFNVEYFLHEREPPPPTVLSIPHVSAARIIERTGKSHSDRTVLRLSRFISAWAIVIPQYPDPDPYTTRVSEYEVFDFPSDGL